jgi:hypothetical protein
MEYRALMAWAKSARILEHETQMPLWKTINASTLEINAIISEIGTVLRHFKQLNGAYTELGEDQVDSDEWTEKEKDLETRDLLEDLEGFKIEYERTARQHAKGLNYLKKMFDGAIILAKRPRAIKWKAKDKNAFDELLERLGELRKRLEKLLDDYHIGELRSNMRNQMLEMIQIRNSVSSVERLMQAAVLLNATSPSMISSEPGNIMETYDSRLELLAKMKRRNLPSNIRSDNTIAPISFELVDVEVAQGTASRSVATYTDSGQTKRKVWIEWKDYDKIYDKKGELQFPSGTLRRTAELTELLQLSKPKDFCTPQSAGFFDDERKSGKKRYGWLFEFPSNTITENAPRSMRDLMLDTSIVQPDLDARVALAQRLALCLLYLHGVNWIHKDIRSDNVVFFGDGSNELIDAKLAGFQFSRPDTDITSESPAHTPALDIYRWHSVQGHALTESRSKKTFDIYGLGLLLLELAFWQPLEVILEDVLKTKDISRVSAKQAEDIRPTLLDRQPKYMLKLRAIAGQKYHDAVKSCLGGYQEFDVTANDDQAKPEAGLKMQRAFLEKVVDRLQKIRL